MGSLGDKLAAALGIDTPTPPCPIQLLFNRYRKHLDQKTFSSPLPEDVIFLAENFPYLIQLENPDPANPTEWIPAKANAVVPLLEKGVFDQEGFRFDESRTKALFNIPDLVRKPNCIHRNLRNDTIDGISGEFMYVAYYRGKTRKVAFTIQHAKLKKIVVVSSFWTYKKWVQECAEMPPHYLASGCSCTCK